MVIVDSSTAAAVVISQLQRLRSARFAAAQRGFVLDRRRAQVETSRSIDPSIHPSAADAIYAGRRGASIRCDHQHHHIHQCARHHCLTIPRSVSTWHRRKDSYCIHKAHSLQEGIWIHKNAGSDRGVAVMAMMMMMPQCSARLSMNMHGGVWHRSLPFDMCITYIYIYKEMHLFSWWWCACHSWISRPAMGIRRRRSAFEMAPIALRSRPDSRGCCCCCCC